MKPEFYSKDEFAKLQQHERTHVLGNKLRGRVPKKTAENIYQILKLKHDESREEAQRLYDQLRLSDRLLPDDFETLVRAPSAKHAGWEINDSVLHSKLTVDGLPVLLDENAYDEFFEEYKDVEFRNIGHFKEEVSKFCKKNYYRNETLKLLLKPRQRQKQPAAAQQAALDPPVPQQQPPAPPQQPHRRRSRSASRRLRNSPPPSSGRSRSSPPFTAAELLDREVMRQIGAVTIAASREQAAVTISELQRMLQQQQLGSPGPMICHNRTATVTINYNSFHGQPPPGIFGG